MSYNPASHETPPDLRPGGELRYYPEQGGRVDVVYKNPGETFGMAEIADFFGRDPVIQDSAAALIQVVGTDGRPQDFFMDRNIAVPAAQPWLLARLDKFPITDPSHNITVGQPWQSPFGVTGKVHAVVLPWNHGYRQDQVKEVPAGKVSRTEIGRRILDQLIERQ